MNIGPFKIDIEIWLGLFIVILGVAIIIVHWQRTKEHVANKDAGVDINEVIEKVEKSLRSGEEERMNAKLGRLFEVKSFDLEMNFVVKTGQSGSGGVDTKLLAVSADSQFATERTQKITLHMETAQPQSIETKPNPSPIEPKGEVQFTSEPPPPKTAPSPN